MYLPESECNTLTLILHYVSESKVYYLIFEQNFEQDIPRYFYLNKYSIIN